MLNFLSLLTIYYILVNSITFFLFGIDKYKAKYNKWRIKEETLLILSLIGGAPGAALAMILFRHKTQKLKFKILIPLFIIIHLLIYLLLIK